MLSHVVCVLSIRRVMILYHSISATIILIFEISLTLRDCNSNIFNDFIRFFESKNWNCVLYGEFCEKIMCPGTQRKSRIKATASVKNVSIIDVP